MADPVTGLIVLGVAATTAKGVAQYSASQQKLQSLDLMQEQNVLRHQVGNQGHQDDCQNKGNPRVLLLPRHGRGSCDNLLYFIGRRFSHYRLGTF